MKTIFGALALVLAVPATAQSAPAANPHAGHAQHHQQGTAPQGKMSHDHAKMMDDCKKAADAGKCEEHCKEMMKKHGAAASSSASTADAHQGHAH